MYTTLKAKIRALRNAIQAALNPQPHWEPVVVRGVSRSAPLRKSH